MTVNSYFDMWFKREAAGRVVDVSIHKFGRNDAVGTTFVPVAYGGVYQTPQVGAATQLRIKAGNADDTAAGTGARKVLIQGLNASGEEVSEELTTAGESASSNSVNSYIRLYRAYVSESGTYATSSAGSHAAAIVIENAAGNADWLTIDANGFPRGQSEVAVYTVPDGYEAYIANAELFVDGNKSADIILFKREGVLETDAPYKAMRTIHAYIGVIGSVVAEHTEDPLGPYPAGTDIGFMAKVGSGTAGVSIDFDIMLLKEN